MLCEKCSGEIETVTCRSCGKDVTALGAFCYCCGSELRQHDESPGAKERTGGDSPDAIDFSSRVLCSDGACIGVVNEQGVCKVCGKPYVPEE